MKRYIKASTHKEWQSHLTSGVYNRLCECTTTKKDIPQLARTFWNYKAKEDGMTEQECLDYILTWVLDWNGGMWDYTQEEYDEWLAAIYPKKSKKSVEASFSGYGAFEPDLNKLFERAADIWDEKALDGAAMDRCDDLDFSIYSSVADLAEDIPAILYILYGLEDGEDYQMMNNSVMYADTANSIWKQVEDELA